MKIEVRGNREERAREGDRANSGNGGERKWEREIAKEREIKKKYIKRNEEK